MTCPSRDWYKRLQPGPGSRDVALDEPDRIDDQTRAKRRPQRDLLGRSADGVFKDSPPRGAPAARNSMSQN
jgi:hypothetical protein